MNDKIFERQDDDGEMLPEYDFSQGIRGKHHRAYRQGYKVIVHQVDGTTEVRDFALPEGTIVLDADVRAYFPDSETVNRTLRELIQLIPEQRLTREGHRLSRPLALAPMVSVGSLSRTLCVVLPSNEAGRRGASGLSRPRPAWARESRPRARAPSRQRLLPLHGSTR